jgi:hypothetical protein
MKDYVMFTLSKSPVKNWIDKGHVSKKYDSAKLILLMLLFSLNVTTEDSGTTLGPSLPSIGRSLP